MTERSPDPWAFALRWMVLGIAVGLVGTWTLPPWAITAAVVWCLVVFACVGYGLGRRRMRRFVRRLWGEL